MFRESKRIGLRALEFLCSDFRERRREPPLWWCLPFGLERDLDFFFFFFNLWAYVLGSRFMFLLFLFKTHLDFNSYDF